MAKPQATQAAAQATKVDEATPAKTKVRRIQRVEDKPWYAIMRLFALPRPEKVTGRDGKKYELFHKPGPSGGAYTTKALMKETGLLKELEKAESEANRRYPEGSKEREKVVKARESRLKGTLSSRIATCRRKLCEEYAPQGLIPLFAKVRVESSDDEPKLYIQGFFSVESKKLVIGSRDDGALWSIEGMARNEGAARTYNMAYTVGKGLATEALSQGVRERLLLELKK